LSSDRKAYMQRYREAHRADRAAYRRRRKADFHADELRRREKRRALLWGEKATRGCAQCGERDPDCLDFHHRDPSQKSKDSRVFRRKTRKLAAVLAEIAKCDVLCANCHRKLTARKAREDAKRSAA
jgi:hypothetical protein